ncbi:hypothetical protein VTK73DRAFT_760 [Phialemonium thermophilum]|uniref:Translation initiation factor IF2/IF5 domain-containing protein n=1 Tax=Phialemonium thermophilum TaxID=223376 RepID=A0ABR3XCW7_9PEZI
MEAKESNSHHSTSGKTVAFTDEQLVVNPNGTVKMASVSGDEAKDTAVSHAPPPDTAVAPPAADDSGLDLSLLKKKKKKPSAKKAEDGESENEGPAAGGEDETIDLSLMKKKKKKKPAAGAEDEFAKKLEALNLEGKEDEEPETVAAEEQDGDMEKGTGIWAHDEVKPIKYDLLLARFFGLLAQKHPDHALSGSRSYKIPPPQCLREGNKKTIFANIAEICKRMKRTEEHVTAYLFAELGTTGSVDGSRRLVIKGRFQQKQIENVLRKYIIEYVTCRTCRSPDTELVRGENRLYFVTCNSCGSRRSVQAIKTGFSAQVGKRRKMQG